MGKESFKELRNAHNKLQTEYAQLAQAYNKLADESKFKTASLYLELVNSNVFTSFTKKRQKNAMDKLSDLFAMDANVSMPVKEEKHDKEQ